MQRNKHKPKTNSCFELLPFVMGRQNQFSMAAQPRFSNTAVSKKNSMKEFESCDYELIVLSKVQLNEGLWVMWLNEVIVLFKVQLNEGIWVMWLNEVIVFFKVQLNEVIWVMWLNEVIVLFKVRLNEVIWVMRLNEVIVLFKVWLNEVICACSCKAVLK